PGRGLLGRRCRAPRGARSGGRLAGGGRGPALAARGLLRGRRALLAVPGAALAAPRATWLLAAALLLVHRGPGPARRLPPGHAALLVALLDLLCLSLLLAGVLVLAATGHAASFRGQAVCKGHAPG